MQRRKYHLGVGALVPAQRLRLTVLADPAAVLSPVDAHAARENGDYLPIKRLCTAGQGCACDAALGAYAPHVGIQQQLQALPLGDRAALCAE